jgi:hypothetical protein
MVFCVGFCARRERRFLTSILLDIVEAENGIFPTGGGGIVGVLLIL